jgi:hypothetical protein
VNIDISYLAECSLHRVNELLHDETVVALDDHKLDEFEEKHAPNFDFCDLNLRCS